MRTKPYPSVTPEQIDACLPQTQCGLCGYDGCMPYAEALVFDNAAIHLCPPGGVTTLKALGECLQKDPAPFIEDMIKREKPEQVAVIREAECIGCAKCIQACPVDAILGSAKQMHTVIADECTGCELCIAPCPVDCIELIPLLNSPDSVPAPKKSDLARRRYNERAARLTRDKMEKNAVLQQISSLKRKRYIEEALLRAKLKKSF